jgi:hypothetical protein
MTEVEKLIYRKKSLQFWLSEKGKLLDLYKKIGTLAEEEVANLKDTEINKLYHLKLQEDIINYKQKFSNLAVEHKNLYLEFSEIVVPKLTKLAHEKQLTESELKDFYDNTMLPEQQVEELLNDAKYKEIDILPEKIEHLSILEKLHAHIDVLQKLFTCYKEEIALFPDGEDELKKTLMIKDALECQQKINILKQRYKQRKDYFENHFLPQHNVTVGKFEKLMPTYLEFAKLLVKHDIDTQIGMVLIEYERVKEDVEVGYQTFLALRERLKRVAKEMRKNNCKYKNLGLLQYAKKELYD